MITRTPPTPANLMKRFADLQADLGRWDANLTNWQHDGNTYPSHNVQDSFDALSDRMDDVRVDLRDLHPEATDLLRSLKRDTLSLARIAGKTDVMADQGITFGHGWSTTLDNMQGHVRSAIDLLAQ